MGNYYQGSVKFVINNRVPQHIMNDVSLYVYNVHSEMFLTSSYVDAFDIEESEGTCQIYYTRLDKGFNLADYTSHMMYEVCLKIYFKINDSKRIDSTKEAILKIAELLRPYKFVPRNPSEENLYRHWLDVYSDAYEDEENVNAKNSNYLGRAYDEDGYYNQEFYWDSSKFDKELEERMYICKGCEKLSKYNLCYNWELCKRAYNIGKADTTLTMINQTMM